MASIEMESTNTDEHATSKQPGKQSRPPEELLGGNNLNNREEATGGSLKLAPTLPEQPPDQKKPASLEGMDVPQNEPPMGEEEDDTSSVGMTASDQEWIERLDEVHAFITEHGTPPQEEDNESLSKWFQEQLVANMERTLAPDRREVLAYFAISFAEPPTRENQLNWDSMYESLCQFKEQNGHVRPTKGNCHNKKLVSWIKTQRSLYKKMNLRPDRLVKLENVGMIWDHNEAIWNSMYECLCRFKEKNGHLRPNKSTSEDKKLLYWVEKQRRAHKAQKLRPDRLVKLENLGISATSAFRSPESEGSAKQIKTKQRTVATMKTSTTTSLDAPQMVSISRQGQVLDTKMAGRAETSEVWLEENVSVPKPSIDTTQGGEESPHDPALNLSVSKMGMAPPPTHQCKKTKDKVPSVGTSEPIVRSSITIEDRSNSGKRALACSHSTKPQKKHKIATHSLNRDGRCSPPLSRLPALVSLPHDTRLINPTITEKTTGSSLVGCRVAKYFADGLYRGKVTRHFPAHGTEEGVDLWHILYEDDDKEDVDETEIHKLVKLYRSTRGDAI